MAPQQQAVLVLLAVFSGIGCSNKDSGQDTGPCPYGDSSCCAVLESGQNDQLGLATMAGLYNNEEERACTSTIAIGIDRVDISSTIIFEANPAYDSQTTLVIQGQQGVEPGAETVLNSQLATTTDPLLEFQGAASIVIKDVRITGENPVARCLAGTLKLENVTFEDSPSSEVLAEGDCQILE